MSNNTVAIAMATFNGEKYIEEQIKSIQASDYKNWKLIIRDDCSQDNTVFLIKKLQATDSRIILLETGVDNNLGYCKNFNLVLTYILEKRYDFFLLSDQDDYWFPEKISLQLKKISHASSPHLIHCDLEIVNDNLLTIKHSFIKHHQYNVVDGKNLNYLLMENHIPGCTILGNRALLELALPFPSTLHNHDWWLAIIASSFGNIDFIDQPLIKYRQHSNNLIGSSSLKEVILNPNSYVFHKSKKHTVQFKDQLIALNTLTRKLYQQSISLESILLVENFIHICTSNQCVFQKIIRLYKYNFRTHHHIRWLIIFNSLLKTITYKTPNSNNH